MDGSRGAGFTITRTQVSRWRGSSEIAEVRGQIAEVGAQNLGFAFNSRLASTRDDSLGELGVEERERYLRFWRNFRLLDRLGWLGFVTFALPYLLGPYLHWSGWRQVSLTGGGVTVVTAVLIRLLHCPRCGVQFWEVC